MMDDDDDVVPDLVFATSPQSHYPFVPSSLEPRLFAFINAVKLAGKENNKS